MTIDEAIKNLKAGRKDAGMIGATDLEYTSIIDLAIAALQRVKEKRNRPVIMLPGETSD